MRTGGYRAAGPFRVARVYGLNPLEALAWPAPVLRAAHAEIRARLSMESDGPAVLTEGLASIATVLGAKKGESVPPEAMSETVARTPRAQAKFLARQQSKMKPPPPAARLPRGLIGGGKRGQRPDSSAKPSE